MKSKFILSFIVALFSLFLVACGGGDSSSDNSGSNEPTGPNYSYHFDIGGGNYSNSVSYTCSPTGNHYIYPTEESIANVRVGYFYYRGNGSSVYVYLYDYNSRTNTEVEFNCNNKSQSGTISTGQLKLAWSYNGEKVTYSLN